MSTNFHLASKNELDLLVSFSQQLSIDDPSTTIAEATFDKQAVRSALDKLIANPIWGRVWFIVADKEPVGYVILTLGYSLEYHGQDAFIDELFIKASHRGQGIGNKVMLFIEHEARQLGVKALHLEVERNNRPALALYRKVGFETHNRYLMTLRIKK